MNMSTEEATPPMTPAEILDTYLEAMRRARVTRAQRTDDARQEFVDAATAARRRRRDDLAAALAAAALAAGPTALATGA